MCGLHTISQRLHIFRIFGFDHFGEKFSQAVKNNFLYIRYVACLLAIPLTFVFPWFIYRNLSSCRTIAYLLFFVDIFQIKTNIHYSNLKIKIIILMKLQFLAKYELLTKKYSFLPKLFTLS